MSFSRLPPLCQLSLFFTAGLIIITWPAHYASADSLVWSTAQLIEDNAGMTANGDMVIAMDQNQVVAVWTQSDGFSERIYSNYSTDRGKTWHSDQLIEDNVGYSAINNWINDSVEVILKGTDAVSVWCQSDGSNWRICSNYSRNGGATWETDQFIDSGPAVAVSGPMIASSDSYVVAIWTSRSFALGPYYIYSTSSNDMGATWSPVRVVEDNTVNMADGNPQVAMADTDVVAVWEAHHYWGDSTSSGFTNYSIDAGQTWGTSQLIRDDSPPTGVYQMDVAMEDTLCVAVWLQEFDSVDRVYSNRSTDGGRTWGTAQLIENNAGNHANWPQVAIAGSNVIVSWNQAQAFNVEYRMYAAYSADGGLTWAPDRLIDESIGWEVYDGNIGMNDTLAVVVWTLWGIGGAPVGICANYSTDGGLTWETAVRLDDDTIVFAGTPEIAVSDTGVVVIWDKLDRIYSSYGSLLPSVYSLIITIDADSSTLTQTQDTYTINGTVEYNQIDTPTSVTLTLNGGGDSDAAVDSLTGRFSAPLTLTRGLNLIRATVPDTFGVGGYDEVGITRVDTVYQGTSLEAVMSDTAGAIVSLELLGSDTATVTVADLAGGDTFIAEIDFIESGCAVSIELVDETTVQNIFEPLASGFTHFRLTDDVIYQFTAVDSAGGVIGDNAAPYDGVTLTWHYNVPPAEEANLHIYYFDPSDSTWKLATDVPGLAIDWPNGDPPGERKDTTADTIALRISHLSVWGIIVGAGAAAPATTLANVVIYPNPFVPNDGDPGTGVAYTGVGDGSGIYITNLMSGTKIEIYDLRGRLVDELAVPIGTGQVQWDVSNRAGEPVASGVYFAVFTNGSEKAVRRIFIVK